jgi:hypothetical protein
LSSSELSPRFGLSILWSGKRNFAGRDWRANSGDLKVIIGRPGATTRKG